eukprot:GHRQ01033225.1.p1 GENE.GHRQ01033225.1~~GHRQ01033225.1.p1  ORF type:complete len:224 (+),score=41.88 GHRQ01033225.1:303-974(+)
MQGNAISLGPVCSTAELTAILGDTVPRCTLIARLPHLKLVMQLDIAAVRAAAACYSKPEAFRPSYGTAGFRAEASLLPSTMFRCGMLIGLKASSCGQACGVMVTASHNPEQDNGLKLVEASGEMLDQAWEAHATQLAQAQTEEQLLQALAALAETLQPAGSPGRVIIGCDTRPSGADLAAACSAGELAVGDECVSCMRKAAAWACSVMRACHYQLVLTRIVWW